MLGEAYIKSLKRSLSVSIIIVILISSCITAVSLGNTDSSNQITVLLNSTKLEFDVNPYIKDGRTLVPFRKIFEAFGLDIEWNPTNQTVFAKNNTTEILLKINDKVAYVNNYKNTLDVPPEITSSRTFVPLRFISESMGADVNWNGNTRTVTITYAQGKYSIGQLATYNDLTFSIDSIDLNLDENTVNVTGKTSSGDRNLYIYLFESPDKYILADSVVTGENGNLFKFEATSIFSSSLNFEKINYIEVQMYTADGKMVKIAEYSPQ